MSGGITAEEVSQGFNLTGKVALVTGATNGIGKETARVLALRNCHVLIGSRSQEKGEETRRELIGQLGEDRAHLLEVFVADLTTLASVREAAARFAQRGDKRLHILVNNAGAKAMTRRKTADGFEENLGVNHLSPFLLTLLLVPYLKASAPSRVVVVSSNLHFSVNQNKFDDDYNMDTVEFDANYFYGNAKVANVLIARELHERLKGTGVVCNSLHPGVILTGLMEKDLGKEGVQEMFKKFSQIHRFKVISIPEGAATQVYLAGREEDPNAPGGLYYVDCKPVNTSPLAADQELQKRVWSLSERLVGLTFEEVASRL